MQIKFNRNSIKTKIIAIMVLMSTVVAILVGTFSYSKASKILTDTFSKSSTQTIAQIDTSITEYIDKFNTIVEMLAVSKNFTELTTDIDEEYATDLLAAASEADTDISTVFYQTVNDKLLVYPVSHATNDFKGKESYWYKASESNPEKVVVTGPITNPATGDVVITISKTVFDPTGKIKGVLAVNCKIDTLVAFISGLSVGDTGYVYLANTDGVIIAHKDKTIINTDAAAKTSIWPEIKANVEGFNSYEYKGTKKYGAYATNEITGWKVVAALNQSELTDKTFAILKVTVILILMGIVVATIIATVFSRTIIKNMNRLKEAFYKASNGDLTVSFNTDSKDEFKELSSSFNTMIGNISILISNITKSSKTIFETAHTIKTISNETKSSVDSVSKAISDVASGATSQAESSQDGVTKMNSLSDKLDVISKNSDSMNKLSTKATELGSSGLEAIEDVGAKSKETKESTTILSNVIQEMVEGNKKINVISEAIAEITNQTNLLSLNASIEAARAGESGKGFAVVADEIKKLAEQSKNSTEEIKVIIANINVKSAEAVKAITLSESLVVAQEDSVNKTRETFKSIIETLNIFVRDVEEIKLSTTEAGTYRDQNMSSIESIAAISEETAASCEEVSASSQEVAASMEIFNKYASQLEILSDSLKSELSKFTN